jgi:hypothetical protein
MAGQIFAMALVHGGPGINCLSSSCYDAIVNESGTQNLSATLDDIPDFARLASYYKLLVWMLLEKSLATKSWIPYLTWQARCR